MSLGAESRKEASGSEGSMVPSSRTSVALSVAALGRRRVRDPISTRGDDDREVSAGIDKNNACASARVFFAVVDPGATGARFCSCCSISLHDICLFDNGQNMPCEWSPQACRTLAFL